MRLKVQDRADSAWCLKDGSDGPGEQSRDSPVGRGHMRQGSVSGSCLPDLKASVDKQLLMGNLFTLVKCS